MGKVRLSMLMETCMKETIRMAREVDLEFYTFLMETSLKDNGFIINKRAKENIHGQMVEFMKEN